MTLKEYLVARNMLPRELAEGLDIDVTTNTIRRILIGGGCQNRTAQAIERYTKKHRAPNRDWVRASELP